MSKYGGADIHVIAGDSKELGYQGDGLKISSGKSSDSTSGSIDIMTTESVESGSLRIATGTAMAGFSGSIQTRTGDTTGGTYTHCALCCAQLFLASW